MTCVSHDDDFLRAAFTTLITMQVDVLRQVLRLLVVRVNALCS